MAQSLCCTRSRAEVRLSDWLALSTQERRYPAGARVCLGVKRFGSWRLYCLPERDQLTSSKSTELYPGLEAAMHRTALKGLQVVRETLARGVRGTMIFDNKCTGTFKPFKNARPCLIQW